MGRGDRGVQVGEDGQGQGAIAWEAFGKTEDFDRFDGVGVGVEAGEEAVAEFFGFLVGVGWTKGNEEAVAGAIATEG